MKIPIINGFGLTNLNKKEGWFTKLLTQLHVIYPNHEFLDIGANIGQTLIHVASAAPQWSYSGFEPNENCIAYLNRLIAINNLKKYRIFPYAVSNKTEQLNLYLNSEVDTTATTLKTFRPNVYDENSSKKIFAISIDEFYKKALNPKTSFILKIDIEGGEFLALQGMHHFLQAKRPIIICEVLDTHSKDTLENHELHLNRIEQLLEQLNYHIYQIIRTNDNLSMSDLKQIKTFERKIWSANSLQLNDYLFIPKENPLNLNAFLN